ncbi:MAG: ATP-binding cassette domain-containing protein [Pseudomonadota bacterium]
MTGLDLHVAPGCLYGLLGPPAAGKTLVLKLIAGLVRPDAGRVRVGGRDLEQLSELELGEHRRSIGMVFQNNALFDAWSVAENVAFPLRRTTDLSEHEIRERVAERLARVGLGDLGERLPTQLSGGQKKRVGIARATVTRAPIVLYDEPTAGLDPVTSRRIFDLLRSEQRAAGTTAVMVSTEVDLLLEVVDRVGMLHEGRLVFDGTPDEARASNEPALRQFLRGSEHGPL